MDRHAAQFPIQGLKSVRKGYDDEYKKHGKDTRTASVKCSNCHNFRFSKCSCMRKEKKEST